MPSQVPSRSTWREITSPPAMRALNLPMHWPLQGRVAASTHSPAPGRRIHPESFENRTPPDPFNWKPGARCRQVISVEVGAGEMATCAPGHRKGEFPVGYAGWRCHPGPWFSCLGGVAGNIRRRRHPRCEWRQFQSPDNPCLRLMPALEMCAGAFSFDCQPFMWRLFDVSRGYCIAGEWQQALLAPRASSRFAKTSFLSCGDGSLCLVSFAFGDQCISAVLLVQPSLQVWSSHPPR